MLNGVEKIIDNYNMTTQILFLVGGILISIIGYFLIRTMNKLDSTADKAEKTEISLALVKQEIGLKHERLEEKMDELKDSIVNLTQEIKVLNNRN